MCVLPPPPTFRLSTVGRRGVPGGAVSASPLPLSCRPHMPRIPSGKLGTEKHPQAQTRNVGQTDQDPKGGATQRQVSPSCSNQDAHSGLRHPSPVADGGPLRRAARAGAASEAGPLRRPPLPQLPPRPPHTSERYTQCLGRPGGIRQASGARGDPELAHPEAGGQHQLLWGGVLRLPHGLSRVQTPQEADKPHPIQPPGGPRAHPGPEPQEKDRGGGSPQTLMDS